MFYVTNRSLGTEWRGRSQSAPAAERTAITVSGTLPSVRVCATSLVPWYLGTGCFRVKCPFPSTTPGRAPWAPTRVPKPFHTLTIAPGRLLETFQPLTVHTHRSPQSPWQMPPRGTQKCTDRPAERVFIAFSAGSERIPKAAAAADVRVGQGSLWRKRHRPLRDQQSSCPGRGLRPAAG